MVAVHGGQALIGRKERDGGGDQRSGVGETAEEPREWFAGTLVVLMRAEDKNLGFCSELSTAAARWWPAEARVVVARAK
jgi:hypothetical protein